MKVLKKVLVDARMVGPKNHGIARYAINLVRGLAAEGVEVDVMLVDPAGLDIIGRSHVKQAVFFSRRFADPLSFAELQLKIRFSDYDLVHFTSFEVPPFLTKNTVVTIHDLIHLHSASQIKKAYFRQIVRRGLLSSGALIAVSEWTARELSEFLGSDKTPSITVIGNSLEDDWLAPASRSPKATSAVNVLAVSNPKPHKNIITLVRAMNFLWRRGHQSNLTLVIGTKELPGFLSDSVDPEFRDRVTLKSGMSENELRQEYQRASVVVSPSQLEGYNFPIAEALSQGTPVVAAKTSANVEFVSPDVHFYEPFDDHEALAVAIEKRVFKLAEADLPTNVLSITQLAKRTLQVYKNL
jgi:glycosyltransferase involved in cell wall biosynthesis